MRIENSCHSDNKTYIIERIDKHFKRRRKKVTAGTILRLEILPLSFSSLKSLHARKPTNPSEHGLLVYFFLSFLRTRFPLFVFSKTFSRKRSSSCPPDRFESGKIKPSLTSRFPRSGSWRPPPVFLSLNFFFSDHEPPRTVSLENDDILGQNFRRLDEREADRTDVWGFLSFLRSC